MARIRKQNYDASYFVHHLPNTCCFDLGDRPTRVNFYLKRFLVYTYSKKWEKLRLEYT